MNRLKCLIPLIFASPLVGLPLGGFVEKGSAEFSLEGSFLSVKAEDKSILRWDDFSIGRGEVVQFVLPDAASWILSRVTAGTPSCIDGSLISNGQILLVNPNGIVIGREGSIQVESFIASTLDLQNEFFVQKKQWAFEGASRAAIHHLGEITVQKNLILIGYQIDASGPLISQGTSALVSARSARVSPEGMLIQTGSWEEGSSVSLSSLLSNPGGAVTLLGQTIFVDGKIEASSYFKPGSISIGGGDGFFPAEQTVVTASSVLSANAIQRGNGGSIYVWSDKRTVFAGLAETTGGDLAGDGGTIEVSGGWVDFRGRVDTRAPFGKTGLFVLDPLDIEIVPGAVDTNVTVLPGPIYIPNASPSSVSQMTLNTALGTSNVTIQSLGGAGLDAGNIFIVADYPIIPIPLSSNTLTLDAFNDIWINALLAYLGPNSGALVLNALSGNILVGNAPTVPAQSTNAVVRTDGNNVQMTARNIFVQGNAAGPFSAQVSALRNGTAFVTATAGDVQVLAANANGAFAQIGADTVAPGTFMDIQVSASQNVIVTGAPATNSYAVIGHGQTPTIKPDTYVGDIAVTAGSNVLVTGASATQNGFAVIGHLGASNNTFIVNTNGDISVTAGGAIALQGGTNQSYARIGNGSLIYNNATVTGSIDVVAGGALTLVGGSSTSMAHLGHQSLAVGGSVGSTTINAPHIRVLADSITMSPGTGGSTTIIGARSNGGLAATTVTISDLTVVARGNLTMNPSPNAVSIIGPIGGPMNGIDSAVTVTAGGDITINNTNGNGNAIVNYSFSGGASNPTAPVTVTARNISIASNGIASAVVASGVLTLRIQQDIRLTGAAPLGTIAMTGINGTDIDAGRDIIISSQTTSALGTVGIGGGALVLMNLSGRVHAGRDILLIDTSGAGMNFSSYIASTGSGVFDVIAGRNMILSNRTLAGAIDQLNLVVDDQFPAPPLIGPGSFQLAAGATVSVSAPENLRIFTARQNQNVILGTLISNGVPASFTPGTPYANIPPELWGVYFYNPFFYAGQVFTIFYKDTLQQAAQQAALIIAELLVDLHPYNEFPGWMVNFYLKNEDGTEHYMLRRRQLNIVNHPKSWTVWYY